ncbi:hypothetical protein RKD20_002297 [Streptomyces sp. SLBN-8D4]
MKYLALQTMCASASATVFFVLGGAAGSAGWRVPFWVHAVSLEGAGQDAHRGRSDRLARQALLDHRDPAGALDHEGQQLEGLHGRLHLGTDPYHAELAGGRGVVGTLVDGPGQTPQLVQGEFVTDLGVIVGDQEQPAVLVEVDGGQAVDDAVRHQQSVDGAQHRGGVHGAPVEPGDTRLKSWRIFRSSRCGPEPNDVSRRGCPHAGAAS